MSDLTRRPKFLKGVAEMEEWINHLKLSGHNELRSQIMRDNLNRARNSSIIGFFDTAIARGSNAQGEFLYKNPGATKDNPRMEKVPINARVTKSWYEVLIPFASAEDDATLALGLPVDDVDGIKAAVAINDSAVAQVDTLTLTGTSGTANVTVGGLTLLATFATSLDVTTDDFVTAHAAALAAVGITVTESTADLIFTAAEAGRPFASPSIVNLTGNLDGSNVNTTANTFGPYGVIDQPVDAIQTGTTANFGEKTTEERDVVVNLGGSEALTAGLMVVYIEYVQTNVA